MVDAQRENHLGLHVDAFLIDAGVDEDGRQLIAFAAFERLLDQQGNRLAAPVAQLQRRNDDVAGLAWAQGDQPAGDRPGFAVAAGQLVDLAGVEDLEQFLQRLQIGFAEDGAALAFQAEFEGFVDAQLGAIHTGEQAGSGRLAGQDAEQEKSHQALHRLVPWRLRCS